MATPMLPSGPASRPTARKSFGRFSDTMGDISVQPYPSMMLSPVSSRKASARRFWSFSAPVTIMRRESKSPGLQQRM